MDINQILKKEFNLRDEQINNTLKLIDEGNTIPFIARYRKEMTGEMSDVTLREFYEKLMYLRNLQSRKDDVVRLIDEQGKLTDEITQNIEKAKTLQEVEDIYAPYKQKKRTRATIAKEKGLEKCLEELISTLDSSNINNVHLSFDIDSIDPTFIPGTGTPVVDGLTMEGGKKIIKDLLNTNLIRSIDFVEFNPSLDKEDITLNNCLSLLEEISNNL